MAIKPILFNTDMVRAILDGRKTQTRRIVKPQPTTQIKQNPGFVTWSEHKAPMEKRWFPPFIQNDILWVRETWNTTDDCGLYPSWPSTGKHYIYLADDPDCEAAHEAKWRPSIHMPKAAARVFLRVTDIRVEELHDITEEDAEKGGVGNLFFEDIGFGDKDYGCIYYSDSEGYKGLKREQFAHLWESTVKKADLPYYGWDANPYVWVIEFERTEQNTPF